MKHVHADKIMRFAKMVEAGHPIEYVTQSRENEHRQWIQDPEPTWRTDWQYRVALVFVEGRPVFRRDMLFSGSTEVSVIDRHSGRDDVVICDIDDGCWRGSVDILKLSWKEPAPTATVPELLRQVADCMEGARGGDYPKFSYAVQGPHMVEVTIGTHREIIIK